MSLPTTRSFLIALVGFWFLSPFATGLGAHQAQRQRQAINTNYHMSAPSSNTESFSPLIAQKSKGNDDNNNFKKQFPDLFTSQNTRQLLGLKDAMTSPPLEKWKTRLQLMKPVTWIPLSLVVMCGAAASGNYHWVWNPMNPAEGNVLLGLQDAFKGLAGVVLAGPFSEGFAQTINDWFDQDIDAINEPYRPIPSGAITPEEVHEQLRMLFLGGLSIAMGLDYLNHQAISTITAITLLGYFMSYIYSAPPLKLKQNGWAGDLAIGLCYISFPWLCGNAIFGGRLDHPVDWLLPIAYSLTGVGAGIVNDFKSMQGDHQFGLMSIPLQVGVDKAKWLASLIPDMVQLLIAVYLYSIGEYITAAIVGGLVLPQVYLQATLLLRDPIANDVKYMALSQPFLFLGLLATALCMGHW